LVMMSLVTMPFVSVARAETIFYEDWESGIGIWYVTNEVWEVGVPTVGPDAVTSGVQCAGTVLDGGYPGYSNTRLVSPEIALAAIEPYERILLKFWHWYYLGSNDVGRVQVSTDNGSTWTTETPVLYDGSSEVWTQACVDLSEYAGQTIRIAFHFATDSGGGSSGWYIDDVSIVTGQVFFENPEGFESGVGEWSADNGLWEVGTPDSLVGPGGAHTGDGCAGTVLDGGYPGYSNTRLVSPEVELAAIEPYERIRLKFWHWYYLGSNDVGFVQVSTDNGSTWTTETPVLYDGASEVWTQACVDLSEYAGQTFRIAFRFATDSGGWSSGWYIDDVSIVTGEVFFENPEGFESGVGEWSADNGLWEVGIHTSGPGGAHTGDGCAATVLDGGYPGYSNTRLVSPEVELAAIEPYERILLKFWHWYYLGSNDAGRVHVSTDNGSTWTTETHVLYDNASEVWTQACVDLSEYAGQTVRIAFYFATDSGGWSSGWYIDDVSIVTG